MAAGKAPTALPRSPLRLLSDKAHSVWGGFEEPGHPAARPSPDQRSTPPCSWLRMVCSPQLTPSLPGRRVHVCVHARALSVSPVGISASLFFSQICNRNHQLVKAGLRPRWPCGCWASELVPGELEVLCLFPGHPGKRR